jgi:6-phosphogluconate dehydrogenase
MTATTKPELAKIGMIGLAVMGENLALNIARNEFTIAVFNRDTTKLTAFWSGPKAKNVHRKRAPSRNSSTRSRSQER